jgi:hypothetical protein
MVVAYRWLRGLEVGKEGFFGGPTWWADSRNLHGQLWFLFAVTGNWRFLAVDTATGVANWFVTGPGREVLPSLHPPQTVSSDAPGELDGPDGVDEEGLRAQA